MLTIFEKLIRENNIAKAEVTFKVKIKRAIIKAYLFILTKTLFHCYPKG